MTGGDPAVDAARRAVLSTGTWAETALADKCAIAAAREALQPFRDRHRPHDRRIPGTNKTERVCGYCLGPMHWPCPDARDAYREDEWT